MQHVRKSVVGHLGIGLLLFSSVALAVPGRAAEAQVNAQPGAAQGDQGDQAGPAATGTSGDAAPASSGGWEPVGAFGEEISVDVVNVEVWVSDEHGRPVTGLTKDDFELLEDGQPRDIVNFAAYEGAADLATDAEAAPWGKAAERPSVPRPTPSAAPAPTPAQSAAPAAAAPTKAPLHLVVLVDNWNLRPESRSRVFTDLRQFIASSLAPGDRVAVMVHDRALELVQGFTDDPRQVAAALDRVEKVAPSGIQMRNERKSALSAIEQAYREWNETNSRAQGGPCQAGWAQMQNAATQFAASVQGHVQRSGGALVSVADLLAGLPDGQRLVVYVGDGLAQTPGLELFQYLSELCPEQRSDLAFFQRDYDMTWLYQEVAKHANAGGVTFFTIEAETPATDLELDSFGPGGQSSPFQLRGRSTPGSPTKPFSKPGGGTSAAGTIATGRGQGRNPNFRPSATAKSIRSQDTEGSLVLIARETGGRSFLNNAGDFKSDFDRLAVDLRNYYSLGFNPAAPGDGGLHPITVRLEGNKHYRLRHRAQYQDKTLEARMVERVRGVAQFGGDENPLGVRIEIGQAVPEELAFRVPVQIWVPLAKLTLAPEGGEGGALHGRLLVLMTATTASGELQPVRQKLVPVTVRGGAEGRAGEKLIAVDVELPPGQQSVALAVRDGLGGTTSYLRHQFRVASGSVEASVHEDG